MSDQRNNIDPRIRKALNRKYEIEQVIGSGGMAIVYQAVQKTLDRKVALKVVHQNFVHDKEFIERFTKEARVLASLKHPNIVTIHDVDSIDQFHYMTMEHLTGEPLSEIIRKNGKLDVKESLKIVAPIAKALDHLHSRGFVHRDVKSSNIFVCEDGRSVLMDFGIVYTSESMLSQPGTVLGTPEFMSPEQANGHELTGSSDLYSLGVILYECLTDSVPFKTDNPLTTVYKVINEAPRPVKDLNSKVPGWLNSQILNLLSKAPSMRVSSANQFVKNLTEQQVVDFSFDGLKVFTPIKEDELRQEAITTKIGTAKSLSVAEATLVESASYPNSSSERTSTFLIISGTAALLLLFISMFLWFFIELPSGENGNQSSVPLSWTSETTVPYFPGGPEVFKEKVRSELSNIDQDFVSGRVYLEADIGINGEVLDSRVILGINAEQDRLAGQVLRNLGDFVPSKREGINVGGMSIVIIDF
ncbi:MAG: serine/threonine-protein kinase [Cyclobacteriaceae bacterium]